MDFLSLAAQCGPDVHPVTTAAIARAEATYDPLAVRNNTLRQSYAPRTIQEAKALVDGFAAKGHKLAIGVMQVTTPWAGRYGLRPSDLLDACTNIRVGTDILSQDYRRCLASTGTAKDPMSCAFSRYWSGNGTIGGAYANLVYRSAGSALRVPETAGVTDGVLHSKTGRQANAINASRVTTTAQAPAPFVPAANGFTPR